MESFVPEVYPQGQEDKPRYFGPSANQDVQEYIDGSRKGFLKKLRDGDFDDVVGLYRSNMSVAVRLPNATLREAG